MFQGLINPCPAGRKVFRRYITRPRVNRLLPKPQQRPLRFGGYIRGPKAPRNPPNGKIQSNQPPGFHLDFNGIRVDFL